MKVEDIRPTDLMAELQVLLRRDKVRWLGGKEFFVRVPCPACGSAETGDPIVVREMTFETCARCETVFYNPRPSETQLGHYYASAESYGFWAEHIFPRTERARRENIFCPLAGQVAENVGRDAGRRDVLLEVGAGFGIFCEEIRVRNLFRRLLAVEPTPKLAAVCRSKGLEVIESPFETVDFPEGSVDCVAAFEVIEHVFSPRDFVTKCRRLLRKGGLLVLTCPNVKGFDFLVLGKDKADNFGLEHINMFHPAAIRLLLESCGFAVREVQTPGRLDADIVRGKILKGGFDVSNQPFLRRVLIEEWDRLGESFQRFLRENGLSSNLLAMAERT